MEKKREKILLVEDNPADARLLIEIMADVINIEFGIEVTDRIDSAMKHLDTDQFQAILLDLSLPDGNGLDTVRRMYNFSPNIPIIVLTGLEDDDLALQAVQVGAQDYLVKGQIEGERLQKVIRFAIQRKQTEIQLIHQATHDALTSLPNRVLFNDRLLQAIERSRRKSKGQDKKWQIAVVMLDLDNFKAINDQLGHAVGDTLLQVVALRMRNSLRRVDTVARLGGDEFTLLFENISYEEDALVVGNKIKAVFSEPFDLDKELLEVTASIGISLYPQDGIEPEILLKHADIAMYTAKQARNGYCFFESKMIK